MMEFASDFSEVATVLGYLIDGISNKRALPG